MSWFRNIKIDFSYALVTVGLLLSHVIAPGSDITNRIILAWNSTVDIESERRCQDDMSIK